jgi:hypothetical protein
MGTVSFLGVRPSVAFETIQNIVRLRIKNYGIRRQETVENKISLLIASLFREIVT